MNIDKIGYIQHDMIKCLNDSKISDRIMWWGKQFQSLIALGKRRIYESTLAYKWEYLLVVLEHTSSKGRGFHKNMSMWNLH